MIKSYNSKNITIDENDVQNMARVLFEIAGRTQGNNTKIFNDIVTGLNALEKIISDNNYNISINTKTQKNLYTETLTIFYNAVDKIRKYNGKGISNF